MPKLTDRTLLIGTSRSTDLMHVVRDGGSFKMELSTLLNNASGFYRIAYGTSELFIFRKAKTTVPSTSLEVGDFCILVNTTEDVMIVGISVSATPFVATISNLQNRSNFLRFYQGSSLL